LSVLAGRFAALRGGHEDAEPEGERDPNRAPHGGLAEGHGLRIAVHDQQIEGQHAPDDQGKRDPRQDIG
jgi:hypothetical protein